MFFAKQAEQRAVRFAMAWWGSRTCSSVTLVALLARKALGLSNFGECMFSFAGQKALELSFKKFKGFLSNKAPTIIAKD